MVRDMSKLEDLVDDNVDLIEINKVMLEMENCLVFSANDGGAGLEEFRRSKPHAAILDIGMPTMNGYDLARAIRREPDGASVFLIAATGWGTRSDEALARQAGFDAHLTKPFEASQLIELISKSRPR